MVDSVCETYSASICGTLQSPFAARDEKSDPCLALTSTISSIRALLSFHHPLPSSLCATYSASICRTLQFSVSSERRTSRGTNSTRFVGDNTVKKVPRDRMTPRRTWQAGGERKEEKGKGRMRGQKDNTRRRQEKKNKRKKMKGGASQRVQGKGRISRNSLMGLPLPSTSH